MPYYQARFASETIAMSRTWFLKQLTQTGGALFIVGQ